MWLFYYLTHRLHNHPLQCPAPQVHDGIRPADRHKHLPWPVRWAVCEDDLLHLQVLQLPPSESWVHLQRCHNHESHVRCQPGLLWEMWVNMFVTTYKHCHSCHCFWSTSPWLWELSHLSPDLTWYVLTVYFKKFPRLKWLLTLCSLCNKSNECQITFKDTYKYILIEISITVKKKTCVHKCNIIWLSSLCIAPVYVPKVESGEWADVPKVKPGAQAKS